MCPAGPAPRLRSGQAVPPYLSVDRDFKLAQYDRGKSGNIFANIEQTRTLKAVEPSGLPKEIEGFVLAHIGSIEELEILLLLQAEPERSWTPTEINARIQSNPGSVGKRLSGLAAAGLASFDPATKTYRFPADSALAAAVSALAGAYREYRLRIVQLIFNRPSDQILGFARAFEIKAKSPQVKKPI